MEILLIILVVLIGLVVIALLLLGVFTKQSTSTANYERIEYLLSAAESDLFQVLLQVVKPEQYVFAKVRISDLIRITGLTGESKAWWKHFAAIAQKHVDFVLATRHPVRPLVAIELDDSSHTTAKARARDALVETVLAAAGLPLVRIPYNSHGYRVHDLRTQLDQALKQRGSLRKTGQEMLSRKPL